MSTPPIKYDTILNHQGCYVIVTKQWLWPQLGHWLYAYLEVTIPWSQEEINTPFGPKLQPRLTYFCGNNPSGVHRYGGKSFKVNPWHPYIWAIAQRLTKETGLEFNAALLNYYRDGEDNVGWHADTVAKSEHRAIASVSLGATRDKRFRRIDDHKDTTKVALECGDALVMWGDTQAQYEHCIPRRAHAGGRINITFRLLE